jgi:hypothetical protein
VALMSETAIVASEITTKSDDEAVEWLYANRCTDGLPVVLPTRSRIEDMLLVASFAGLDRDLILGLVGPTMGEATVEKVAINAVMAGCEPQYFPVVIAAIRALCDPRMDTTEVQATTHDLAPLLIVNGPISKEIGISGSYGALGYGHRANLTIGRAVRLCMINLGGGWPGVSDMASLGQPGKLSYCLAEDEENSPFPPLHTSLGFTANQSAVTVTGVGAPHSAMAIPNADDPQSADRILELIARTISSMGNNGSTLGTGTIVVCLNPDHAQVLHEAGHTRESIQKELWRLAVNPATLVQRLRLGSLAPTDTDPDEVVHAISGPEAVLVFVAGGPSLYTAVMLPWTQGPHRNPYVSVEIVTTDACEVPVSPLIT